MDLTNIEHGLTPEEEKILTTYIQNGCIGLEKIVSDENKVNSMFSLYMSGKSYLEISRITRSKKETVYYMAVKMRWHRKRMEYLESIQNEMAQKLTSTRVESVNFIADLISFHHQYYGERINKYLSGDKTAMEGVDLKNLSQYFKSIEVLEKVINPSNVKNSSNSPVININAGNSKIEQKDGKTIEISTSTTGDILKALAKLKDSQK